MARRGQLTPKQRALKEHLSEVEKADGFTTYDQMADAAGYKRSSLRTMFSEGFISKYLVGTGPEFKVQGIYSLTDEEFHRQISQSHKVREFGYNCKTKLGKSLLEKSRDNMVLALELYNRPTLMNRIDGFVLLFASAWELLLKAIIVEQSGEQSVFRKMRPGRKRETIGFSEAIEAVWGKKTDPARKNLEQIKALRDESAHLLLRELQPIASRLFQAGVLNFGQRFRDFAGEPFIPRHAVGLMTLVGEMDRPTVVQLSRAYGRQTADELLALHADLEAAIKTEADNRFAISLESKAVITKRKDQADIIIAVDSDGTTPARIVKKPVDPARDFLAPKKTATEVNRRLREALSPEQFETRLHKEGRSVTEFNMYDLQAMAHKLKLKKSNNEYHYYWPDLKRRKYSPTAVELMVEKVVMEPDYVARARESHQKAQRQSGKK